MKVRDILTVRQAYQREEHSAPEYEQTCTALLRHFEEARRLKMKEGIKIWLQ